jgi:hypothetical protein
MKALHWRRTACTFVVFITLAFETLPSINKKAHRKLYPDFFTVIYTYIAYLPRQDDATMQRAGYGDRTGNNKDEETRKLRHIHLESKLPPAANPSTISPISIQPCLLVLCSNLTRRSPYPCFSSIIHTRQLTYHIE